MAAAFDLEHPLFTGRTGRGVRVAVLDSGIHVANPHISSPPVESVHLRAEGEDDCALDVLGHGTAVAAAILEKAPAIELIVVRIFERTLSTSAGVLARAIEWAAERDCRLINLSLGTADAQHADPLRAALACANERGAVVVSAREWNGRPWLPGSLPGAVGVLLDPDCPRDELRCDPSGGGFVLRASGLPRPIPGVPPERNVRGVSFAVANTTGFLARLMECSPELRSPEALEALLNGL